MYTLVELFVFFFIRFPAKIRKETDRVYKKAKVSLKLLDSRRNISKIGNSAISITFLQINISISVT